jgi:hypothetical protein
MGYRDSKWSSPPLHYRHGYTPIDTHTLHRRDSSINESSDSSGEEAFGQNVYFDIPEVARASNAQDDNKESKRKRNNESASRY